MRGFIIGLSILAVILGLLLIVSSRGLGFTLGVIGGFVLIAIGIAGLVIEARAGPAD